MLLVIWRHFKSPGSRLILLGGFANLIDRLAHGAVTDWLTMPRIGLWFNLADIYINLGLALVIWELLQTKRNYASETAGNNI